MNLSRIGEAALSTLLCSGCKQASSAALSVRERHGWKGGIRSSEACISDLFSFLRVMWLFDAFETAS